MSSLRYFVVRALKNVKGDLFPNLASIGIIAISMLLFAAFSLIAFNLASVLKTWEDRIEVIAYLKKKIAAPQAKILVRDTLLLQGVEAVKYISSSEAMDFMETKMGSQKSLLEGIDSSVLPPSLEIKLKKDYRNATRIKEVVAQLKQFPEIEEIQYGKEWVETFSMFVHIVRVTQWILGGLLLAAMTFIIANTLQGTIDSRQEEIKIMNWVGASPSFIQVPFYVEGLIQGLLGTAVAMVMLFFLYKLFFVYITPSVKEWLLGVPLFFFPPRMILWFLSGGMVLGFFGSFVASLRILKHIG